MVPMTGLPFHIAVATSMVKSALSGFWTAMVAARSSAFSSAWGSGGSTITEMSGSCEAASCTSPRASPPGAGGGPASTRRTSWCFLTSR